MQHDSISGLDAADMRWYSPAIERWTSVDPMGFRGGNQDLYGFVSGSPVHSTDASGLQKAGRQPFKESETLGGDTIRKKVEKEQEKYFRKLRQMGATKVKCPTGMCGFTVSLSKFKITSIDITSFKNGNVPFPKNLPIQLITVKDVKKEIERELKGKDTYTRSNCGPGCTPDASKAQKYSGRLVVCLEKVPLWVPNKEWYVVVSGSIELVADAVLTPCTKK